MNDGVQGGGLPAHGENVQDRDAETRNCRSSGTAGPHKGTEMTIREACLQASSFLTGKGVEAGDAAASAEWLLEHLLGCSRSELFMRWNESFPAEQSERWNGLLERRAAGEPVQYITGEQEFYGLPFRVTSAVLIPRPETELLVEKVMELGRRKWPEGRPLVADIGCGSGAIPVTLAVKCSPWNITASDISPEAIEVARGNALLNGVGDKVAFYQGDLLEVYIRERIAIDILVSNPPYIESGDIAFLQREVRLHEPVLALDGGTDGLDFYRRIVGQVELLPSPPALIGFEVGQGQAPDVAELLRSGGHWDEIIVVPDLAGIERHVIGLKKN